MVWRSGNTLVPSTKFSYVKPGIGIAFGRFAIPVFFWPLRPTQPGHPSVDRCSEYGRWFGLPLEKKQKILCRSGPQRSCLAIPPWIGAVSMDDGLGYHLRRSGEFCVEVDLKGQKE